MSDLKPVEPHYDSHKRGLLEKFRERTKDCKLVDPSDGYLLQWLIARNYDVDQAEKMLRQSLEWRRLHKMDEILDTYQPNPILSQYFSMGRVGKDKMGCPLWFSAMGRVDFKGILQSVTKKEFTRMTLWTLESIERDTSGHSNQIGRATFVFDLEEFSLRALAYKPALDILLLQIQIYERNFPGNLRRVFVINAPKIFPIVFKLIQPLLNHSTLDKMKIFNSNKEEWLPALLEEISADEIPAHYGGSLTDPDGDPKCPGKFNMGGKVPKELYMRDVTKPIPNEKMETFNLIGGFSGKKKIKLKVDKTGSIFRWEFMTEGGEIAYRIYRENLEEGKADLIPLDRVESHLFMEEGQLVCDVPGTYVVEFNNSFSYVTSKKVFYRIDVTDEKCNSD